MTNADKIRSMTDEELFEWIDEQQNQERDDWKPIGCYHCIDYGTHHYPRDCVRDNCEWANGVLNWLKQEYEE